MYFLVVILATICKTCDYHHIASGICVCEAERNGHPGEFMVEETQTGDSGVQAL